MTLANTVLMGEGVLYNILFTEFPFKTVSGDVTAFHRIAIARPVSEILIHYRLLSSTYLFRILTHLKLYLAHAIRSFKWMKDIPIYQIGG